MSVYASRWALDHLGAPDCTLSATARSVVLVLAAEAHWKTGQARTGGARLAALLGVHRDTVWRAVRELRTWPPLPSVEARGRGVTWHFPVSTVDAAEAEVVPTIRADADGAVIPTIRADATTIRAHADGPSAPTRIEGLGTYVEKGAAPIDRWRQVMESARDAERRRIAEHTARKARG